MKILVLNAGSSSHKSCLYDLEGDQFEHPSQPLWEGCIDWTRHQGMAELTITAQGHRLQEVCPADSRQAVIKLMLGTLCSGATQVIAQLSDIDVVGHRVVHGGQDYQASTLITPAVKATIEQLSLFAPLHNPVNVEGVNIVEQLLPDTPQVAIFDTAFHSRMPQEASVYPGPYAWFTQGLRRYGFHGISHHYSAQRTAQILQRDVRSLRLITCHLGNGCSIAAIRDGYSVDTTMGFTPLEGLMMGTRSGSIDPGLLLYLVRQQHYSVEELAHVLNHSSGLKGISGISSDMRHILQAREAGDERAELAFSMFIHRLRAAIGAQMATLGGVDALVFTGGIGEHSPLVRQQVCLAFAFLGLALDPEKNASFLLDHDIASADSTVRVVVVHAEEAWAIARECWQVMTRIGLSCGSAARRI
jgi:acetate kinase